MTLFMVGDIDQLLYRFSGAKPELMTKDVDQFIPDIQTKFLGINYRSTQEIVERCSKLIERNYSEWSGPHQQKFMKGTSCSKDAPEGEPITFKMLPTVKEEAQYVADTITEQLANGYEFGDFFIGSRTRAQLGYLEGTLFRADIKFVNITGGSFWENFHVANIIAFMKLAHDTADNDAFGRIYNIASSSHTDRKGDYCNHHWMGAEFLRLCQNSYGLMQQAIKKNKRYYYGVTDLQNFIQDIQMEAAYADSPSKVIDFIMDNCYADWLKAKGERIDEDIDSNIQDDIATIKDVADEYDTIASFLAYVDDMVKVAQDAKKGNLDDYVVLSTIHRLKGQERPIVCGIGWCEGQTMDGEPRGLLPHTFSLTPPPNYGVLPTSGMARIEDERCIGFVCVSRAMDKVFLSGCIEYRNATMGPSRFIEEMGLLEEEEEELENENENEKKI